MYSVMLKTRRREERWRQKEEYRRAYEKWAKKGIPSDGKVFL